jgi:hypothetical protein
MATPRADIVYLVGKSPTSGWRPWALTTDPHWEPAPSYYEGATPILRYEHAGSGRRIEFHHSSAWFPGAQDYDVGDAWRAWEILRHEIAHEFDGASLLATPATTGRECWLRTIPWGREYPALDADSQDFLRHTLGQARIEGPDTLLADWAEPELPGAFEYDGRLFYGALCWGLPAGIPSHDFDAGFHDMAPGRYRVAVRVPQDWERPFGLLGVKDSDGERWRYPARPGEQFTTWADGAELRLAFREGWEIAILERFLFPRREDPLRTWAEAMIRIRRRILQREAPDEIVADVLAGRAVRHMILTTIGAFQGRPHKVTEAAPLESAAAEAAPLARARIEDDWLLWSRDDPARWPGLAHPEWCSTIWGRARARLLEAPTGIPDVKAGALHLAPGSRVIAFRTDAIYTTGRQAWPDDGREGRFRLVAQSHGPIPTPRTATALLNVRARAMVR